MKLVHNDKSLSLSSNGLSVICSLYEGIMFMGKAIQYNRKFIYTLRPLKMNVVRYKILNLVASANKFFFFLPDGL